MDGLTKALANGASIAVTDMVMFGSATNSAVFDGVALAGATMASAYLIPTADTFVPSSMNDITNLAITGAVYAAADNFITNSSPFNGFLPTALWGIANVSLGSNTIYPIVSLNTL